MVESSTVDIELSDFALDGIFSSDAFAAGHLILLVQVRTILVVGRLAVHPIGKLIQFCLFCTVFNWYPFGVLAITKFFHLQVLFGQRC